MKSIAYILALLVIAAGAWYFLAGGAKSPRPEVQGTPSGALGINGSPNQGNLGQPDTGAAQQPQESTGTIAPNVMIATHTNVSMGTFLTGKGGMTLYSYDKDSAGASNCTGTCAENWPPFTIAAGMTPNIQAGVNGNIATVTRADGSIQLVYNGKLLYFYKGDKAAADTTGDGIGGVWHVVKP